ncbi:MAG: molybdopterin-dependent oxidoreductase [Smithellaceae bacterium]|nr:molybdopterin-dependent oxidoreductase [Smithellaceae bacterium]
MKIRRRDFLKGAAALGTVASVGLPGLNLLGPKKAHAQAPATSWKPTTCEGCTTWCAMEVLIQEEAGIKRAISVRGNQHAKTHGGYSCPRGNLALQELYDPDRIKQPMKRTNPGPKGIGIDPQFVPISWDEAVTEIAARMMALRNASPSESHKLAVLRGRYTEMNGIIYDDLPPIFGTPNKVSHSSICAEAEKFGYLHTLGLFGYPDYDLNNTDFLLLWGVDPVSSNRLVPGSIGKLGDLLEKKKVVVVDPRLSSTATKAHQWLPVKPGTDGALALAMAHVILAEGRWYKDFVGDFNNATPGDGFATTLSFAGSLAQGRPLDPKTFTEKGTKGLLTWWNLELRERTPAWAAEITGIPVSTIIALAREFAAAAPRAISWLGPGAAMQPRAGYGSIAIAALNGLVGSTDHVGGVLPRTASISPGLTGWIDRKPYVDNIADEGYKKRRIDRYVKDGPSVPLEMPAMSTSLGGVTVTNRVADAINDSSPYDVKMVIGYWLNFAFSCQGADRWAEALAKVYYVHMGTNACETTWLADIVLPAQHHMFETLAYMNQKAMTYNVLTLNQPVVDKLWDTKEVETEFIWLLAKKMSEVHGWSKLFDYLKAYAKPFADPAGDIYGDDKPVGAVPSNETEFHKWALKRRLCGASTAAWASLVSSGIRQATYAADYFDASGRGPAWRFAAGDATMKSSLATKSKKFEFCNEDPDGAATEGDIKRLLRAHAGAHKKNLSEVLTAVNYPMTAAGIARLGNAYAYMPHWEAPDIGGDPKVFPFVMIDYKSRLNREGRSQNAPWYYEFKVCDPGDERWSDVVKMNPAEAKTLGLADGALVRITSPTNQEGIVCRLKLWEGVGPGTIAKSYGQGHRAYGKLARAQGVHKVGTSLLTSNNNNIIPVDFERLSGSSARNGVVRVKITAL